MMGSRRTDYTLILSADVKTLRSFERITDQLEFDELLTVAFEKLIYLKDDACLYDFIHDAFKHSYEVTDLQSLITQTLAISRHVDESYRWIVGDLTYDSFFIETYRIKHMVRDYNAESLIIVFEEIR